MKGTVFPMSSVREADSTTGSRKEKLANFQNGHIYLTSHRLCYVDNHEPRKHAVAIALKEVDHGEFHVRLVQNCNHCNSLDAATGWISQSFSQGLNLRKRRGSKTTLPCSYELKWPRLTCSGKLAIR